MRVVNAVRMLLALFITFVMALPASAFDRRGAAMPEVPAGGRDPGDVADPAVGGVGPIPGGRNAGNQIPANARNAIQQIDKQRQDAGQPPLTVQERNLIAATIGAANQTGRPPNAEQSKTIAEGVIALNTARTAEGQPPLTQSQINQVANAFVWGFQFVKSADNQVGKGFTVTHNGTEARVVLAEGSKTNNMKIVVPGQQTGNVNLTSKGEGHIQFAMLTDTVGRGSAQFTQATIVKGLDADNRGGFQNATNVAGHVANAAGFPQGGFVNVGNGPGQVQLNANVPDVPAGQEVRITAAAVQGGPGVALNYAFDAPTGPTSPGSPGASTVVGSGGTGIPGGANANPLPGGAPAGHNGPGHHGMTGSLPTSVQMPSAQETGGWRNAPLIPQAMVDTVADTNGAAVAAMPNVTVAQGQAPQELAVVVSAQPGDQNLVVIQTPPQFNNVLRVASANTAQDMPLQVTVRDQNDVVSVLSVSANATRESNDNGGREMGQRNGALAFTIPAGLRVESIQTMPGQQVPQAAALELNRDMTKATFSMIR